MFSPVPWLLPVSQSGCNFCRGIFPMEVTTYPSDQPPPSLPPSLFPSLPLSPSLPPSLLLQDNDNRVREASHKALQSCVNKVKGSLGPHFRSLVGSWVSGMCDPHGSAASAAQAAFSAAFAPPKQIDALKFGFKAIVNVCHIWMYMYVLGGARVQFKWFCLGMYVATPSLFHHSAMVECVYVSLYVHTCTCMCVAGIC